MAKIKSTNQKKYLVIAVAIALAGAAYLGYRSMLVEPTINAIESKRGSTPRSGHGGGGGRGR